MTTLNNFENVLQHIHSKYVSQAEDEVARNNVILETVVDQILFEMKKDAFFNEYFSNKKFYGGSYYDGLKVGSPDKFDLYLIIKLPTSAKPILQHSNKLTYLYMRFGEPERLSQAYQDRFLEDIYFLSARKVRAWMKSVFSKALNAFGSEWNGYNFGGSDFYLQGSRSEDGPEMILRLEGGTLSVNIDFVPCFEFTNDQWPNANYRQNPIPNRKTFLIVPKSPLPMDLYPRHWRPIFQEQERELIHDKGNLKPTLKLLKRLRDVHQHKSVTNYCIKTMFLWENEKNGDDFWEGTMTDVFFKMLDKYISCIYSDYIPYFWQSEYNLLHIPPATRENMVNRLRKMQKDLQSNYKTDPLIMFKYLDYPRPQTSESTGNGSSYTSSMIPERYAYLVDENGHALGSGSRYSYQTRNLPSSTNTRYSTGSVNSVSSSTTRTVYTSKEDTSTATTEGLSGFAKLAIGFGLAAVAGGLVYGLSGSSKKNEDSDED